MILDGLPSVRSDGTVTAPCLALAKLDRKGIARLREEERNFSAKRNKSFGNPNYQLKRELEARPAGAARDDRWMSPDDRT